MNQTTPFIITILAAMTLSMPRPSSAASRNNYLPLVNMEGRKVEAKILHVGDHNVYLRRGLREPLRVPLSVFNSESRAQLEEWKQTYGTEENAERLVDLVELARKVTPIDQPLMVDPDPAKAWKRVETFSDEFNTKQLNEQKWNRRLAPWGERAWRSDNVWQKRGSLFIQAKYDPHKDRKGREYFYTLGIMQSTKKTTYGYFEARIKGCSRFPGLCPAFWLYSNGRERNPDLPNITYSEIDIVEMLQGGYDPVLRKKTGPEHVDCNLHTREIIDGVETWRRPQHWPEVCQNAYSAPWDPRDDFHVYACENNPTNITWYIDGIKVAESPNHNWHLPMNVTLTMELRPPLIAWAGVDGREPVPEASTRTGFPTQMEVDYVRVWEHK